MTRFATHSAMLGIVAGAMSAAAVLGGCGGKSHREGGRHDVDMQPPAVDPGAGSAGFGERGSIEASGGYTGDGSVAGAPGGSTAISVPSNGAGVGAETATGGGAATGGSGGAETCVGSSCAGASGESDFTPSICTPGTSSCQTDAEKVLTCSDSGLGQNVADDCGAKGQVCVSGACVPVVCEPGATFCGELHEVDVCSAKGDRFTVVDRCGPGQTCNTVTLTCTIYPVCTPNQPVCDGDIATTCSADGTGYAAGGTSCADTGQVCVRGTCMDCWPTTYFCSGTTVRHCAVDGMSSTVSATCTSSEYCDSATATCKAQACTPNQPVCDGEIATTCNADGSRYAENGALCTDTGQFCDQGACASLACAPNTDFCSGSMVQHCAADGMSSTVSATCASSEYCDSATATCETQICTPKQPVCQGNIATTCNADGSGYDAGTDCSGEWFGVCANGQCMTVSCSSAMSMCFGSVSVQCYGDWDGSVRACTGSQYCDSANGSCQPIPYVCVPSQPTCDNNTATVCTADGLGYKPDGSPCGARFCVSGACRNVLFAEDFEDGDYAGWQVGAAGPRSVATTDAAAGTLRSFKQSGADGIYRNFLRIEPNRVSWWVMAASNTAASGGFILSPSAGTSDGIAYSYFEADGTIVLGHDALGASIAVPYAANLWYHLELRNFDWTAKTFDYYVNDTLIRAAAPFRTASAADIGRVDLSNPGNATAYWDEITFE
jgi:hypothetical protein